MTKRDKRLQRIRRNPKNVSFEALRQVLEDHGFTLERVSGSHHMFRAASLDQVWVLNVPLRKPHVKLAYVLEALRAIDAIQETISQESEENDGNPD